MFGRYDEAMMGIKTYSKPYNGVQVNYTNNNSSSSNLFSSFSAAVSFDFTADYFEKGVKVSIHYDKKKFNTLKYSATYHIGEYAVTLKPDEVVVSHTKKIGVPHTHTVNFQLKKDGFTVDSSLSGTPYNIPKDDASKISMQDHKNLVHDFIKSGAITKVFESQCDILKIIQSEAYKELVKVSSVAIPAEYVSPDKLLMGHVDYKEFFDHLDSPLS